MLRLTVRELTQGSVTLNCRLLVRHVHSFASGPIGLVALNRHETWFASAVVVGTHTFAKPMPRGTQTNEEPRDYVVTAR